MKLVMAGLLLLLMALPAQARHKGHHAHRHHARHVGGGQIVPNPAGCPRTLFCGCGVARFVFGQVDGPMRPLWLASEWLRRFARATPAPGMVAVRKDRHHVLAIKEVRGNGRVLAYDPNSGGHKTRVHEVSLARYTVVDPQRRL
jgi:hypothetical protein